MNEVKVRRLCLPDGEPFVGKTTGAKNTSFEYTLWVCENGLFYAHITDPAGSHMAKYRLYLVSYYAKDRGQLPDKVYGYDLQTKDLSLAVNTIESEPGTDSGGPDSGILDAVLRHLIDGVKLGDL